MGLSNDLISQFDKMTKDKTENKKETIVYGTIQKDNNGNDNYVNIDGSNISTPVKKTVVAGEGDRVTVMIKNHTATVTGNVSKPAARDDDKANAVEFTASTARIAQLEANKANVSDLNAANVKIANLEVNKANASELNVVKADVEYLKALDIDTDMLKTAKAFVDDLKASNANIEQLVSNTAKVNNLIFGSAGGDVIQTSFSNSVIGQLGNAQIKSAMIESVSASKITAGDIITNNVRIKSNDGRLFMSDETLQISDNNRVRVQIGKDASNDYSINVWDQNGKLMFSKGGITDAAIKEAIIRNDMVSDTANIHASKLNIDSLFEEINDSSNTIKATKVYLDDEAQTLDVVFKTLATEKTAQDNIISSQGTAISAIQGQISSKIWQQDINSSRNEMVTQYSLLQQNLDEFKTTVSNTYSPKSTVNTLGTRIMSAESNIVQLTNNIAANVSETTNLGTRTTTLEQTASGLTARLDDIHIGGRNLLRNSRLVQMYSNNANLYPISCIQTTENGVTFYRVRRTDIENYPSTALSIYSTIPKSSFEYGEMAGKQVTLSFKVRASHEVTSSFMDFTYGGDSVVDFGKPAEKITTKWKTYHVVIDSFPDMTNRTGVRWNPYNISLTSDILADFYIDICDYKFEFGNHPTDWSPAPEDVESDILDASKTATNYLSFSSSGLVIGDMTASTLGKNVLIDSDSVDIRNGSTTLASFGADYLYLAKNSRNATIDLCNGLAKLYHQSRLSYDTLFVIETPNATEIRGTSDPLCVTSTVASKPAIKFANSDGVLGSIGMVASGTESYITRNHPSTTATYSILDTGNYYKLMDSGWFNGGLLGDNFTVYNDNSQVKYRKIGKQVQIMGTVKPRVDIEGSTTQHTIFTLPSGYRPPYALHQVCYGSNNYTWRLTVNTNGTVCFSRYGLDSGYVTAAVGHWINFQATFFID